MFRMCFIDPYQGVALANFAFNELNLRKTAFLGDVTNIYCEGIQNFYREEFEKLGGKVVSEEGMMATDVDFRAQLTSISESGADSLLLATGSYKVVSFVAKQIKQLGIDIQLLGVDGWYAKELLDLAGQELEGAFMTNMVSDDDPMFEDYIEQFTKKHPGVTPNVYAYYALDAMMSIVHSIKEAGVANSVAIAEQLSVMKDVPVFTGTLTMEPDTHNPHNRTVSIIEVKDSKFTTYRLYTPED
jgi:branched-chain amino acid transport system substrate-binding protein